MAKTKDGMLVLGKREIEALKILKNHTMIDLNYGEGGTFNINNGGIDNVFDAKEAQKAQLGIGVIDFILEIIK